MERKDFLKTMAILPLAGAAMKLNALNNLTKSFANTGQMPVLFVGHGSPMNAIEDNEFTQGWISIGKDLPKPNAILCVSAHWETKGTYVTAMPKPQTIHDFGGFPQALFDVEYTAPGSPEIAQQTKDAIHKTSIGLDEQWGLDHGCWSILNKMYPKADVPVIQLSLDYTQSAQYHYDLAKELAALRRKGVLIIGSGNMVHNLGMVAWDKINEPGYGYDWAIQANNTFKKLILANDHASLINYKALGKEVQLSAPSPDHYLPLLYALALKQENEKVTFFNDKTVMGSLSMTSLVVS